MAKILFLDRFGELNFTEVTQAYVSCFQETTRLVIGTNGWDMPREAAESWVWKLAKADRDELLDLRELGKVD